MFPVAPIGKAGVTFIRGNAEDTLSYVPISLVNMPFEGLKELECFPVFTRHHTLKEQKFRVDISKVAKRYGYKLSVRKIVDGYLVVRRQDVVPPIIELQL